MKPFYDHKKHGTTQSMLTSWMKCREYSRLVLDGWTPRRVSPALQFGTVAHGVLEHVYGGSKTPPSKQKVLTMIESQLKAWRAENTRAGESELQTLEYHGALLDAVLPDYFDHWSKEDFGKTKWVSLEEEFSVTVWIEIEKKLIPITLRGKTDGVYSVGNDYYLFETKTKSRIDEGTLRELLMMDFQTMLYCLAILKKYKKIPKGVRYNIIRRPANKQGKAENLQGFTKRVRESVQEKPEYYFLRYKISIEKQHVLEFEAELKSIVTEFVLWRMGKLPTYKNTHSCVDKYGTCSMLPICSYQNYSGFYKRPQVFNELKNHKEGR